MKRKYFGTDGVRGPFGGPVINEDFAFRLGVAAGAWLREKTAESGEIPLVLIGRDTRFSGPALEAAVGAGFARHGLRVGSVGVAPTPAVSLAVRHFQAALGVVITASHNPADDNGIKFFSANGDKLPDEEEARIEALLPSAGSEITGQPAPYRPEPVDAVDLYVRRLSALLPARSLAGWTIALDAAHGAAFRTSLAVLTALGATVHAIGIEPDGHNINAGFGSLYPEKLTDKVRATSARVGIAHDGDADRVVLCDETGDPLDGDEIMAILALHALREGGLKHRTLVATVQSNLGLKACLEAEGGRIVSTAVGDRYVVEAMMAGGFNLGGESSGHIIFSDIAPCGDGLLAGLKVLEVMLATGRPLSELRRRLVKFPQCSRALGVKDKPALESLPTVTAAIAEIEHAFGNDGRVLVRYSGTEPKIRLLVEGRDEPVTTAMMEKLEAAVRRDLVVTG